MSDRDAHLIRSLIESLDLLQASIHSYIDAVLQGGQPLPVELRSEIRLPTAIREYYEAEQRERQSRWKTVKPWLEVLGVAVAFALAVLTFRTLKEIRQQTPSIQKSADAAGSAATTAMNQLNYSERPWISAKIKIVGSVRFDDPTTIAKATTVHMLVTLKNVGHSVALRANDWEDVIPIAFGGSWQPALDRQQMYCDAARSEVNRWGNPMFPEQEDMHGSTAGPAKTVLDAVKLMENGLVSLVLVGCVDYRSTLDNIHHQTRFAYFLGKPSDRNSFEPWFSGFNRGGIISGLRPVPLMVAGNSVD
jgi:hypothetical protein